MIMQSEKPVLRLFRKMVPVFLVLFSGFLCRADSLEQYPVPYRLDRPDHTYVLPQVLQEISGIAMASEEADSTIIACIQDEKGVIFLFDTALGRVTGTCRFAGDGDYEGIAVQGEDAWVLRSDGALFWVRRYRSAAFKTLVFATGIAAGDNEGLCLDRRNKRLLIACKSNAGRGAEFENRRMVYGFDLDRHDATAKPVAILDLAELKDTKKGKKKDQPHLTGRLSDLAVHPLTGELYLLSAVDRRIFVLDASGAFRYTKKLDPQLFNKPEGLTFRSDGQLYVSNEGESGKPTILEFAYHGSP